MPNKPREGVKVYIDGCAKGNPGPAGAGFVVENLQGELIEEKSVALGDATNNEAEYRALILAMEHCLKMKMKAGYFYTDSELLANQLNGIYRIKSANLARLAERVDKLREKFDSFQLAHVPRELNARADRLANLALKPSRDGASAD
jgi:ribonuclease HI